ncbi:MAB_1171c family putative transporter [Sphaerisporangium dianthi]|uniref:MAB_1171c family putative transporter n=1 Tax=Sphaerisporangium dianthi TaxID=1436120 RepID=A0ABV9CP06_9ACTN
MNTVLYTICAVLAWLAVFNKVAITVRSGADPARLALCTALFFMACTMTVAIPAVWVRVDTLVGVPNVSALLSQGMAAMFGLSIHLMVSLIDLPKTEAGRTVRRHIAVAIMIQAIMVLLFLRIPPGEEAPTDFVVRYADDPDAVTYLGVYIVIFAAVQVRNTALCWRYANAGGRPWLRRGLRMVAVASFLGLVYSAIRGADLLAGWSGLDVRVWEVGARMVIFSGVVLASLGCTAPSWGPKVTAMRGRGTRLLDYTRLYRLWAVLYRAMPDIALDPPSSLAGDLLASLRDLDFRLYRRVIEITDAMLVLRPHYSAEVAAEARTLGERHGLTGDALQATIEAVQMRRALLVRGDRVENARAPEAAPGVHPASPDINGEVRRLVEIARAFDRLPAGAFSAVRTSDRSPRQPTG